MPCDGFETISTGHDDKKEEELTFVRKRRIKDNLCKMLFQEYLHQTMQFRKSRSADMQHIFATPIPILWYNWPV